MKQCKIEGCSNRHVGLGYCRMHYTRFRKYGDPFFPGLKGGGRPKKIKFDVVAGCFVLRSHKLNEHGYSEIMIKGKTKKIHRHMYEECFGEIPEGLVVRHKCDNPSCINPEHLEIGTHQDNVKDMVSRKRQAKGEKKANSVLTDSDVMTIRSMLKQGMTNREIARKFNIDESVISLIKHNKAWKHVN